MMPLWFPWYPALYRGDTMHLTPAQDGIYRRLIDHYMETRKPLLDSDQALAGIARIGLDEWLAYRSSLLTFFSSRDGKLHHKRCDDVLRAQDTRALRRSRSGKIAAAARYGKNKDVDTGRKRKASAKHTSGMRHAAEDEEESLFPEKQSPELNADNEIDALRMPKREREIEKDSIQSSENPLQTPNLIYAWKGKIVRLTKADYDQWRKVYSAIPDFDAELQRIDDSLTSESTKNWFPAASAMLGYKHQQFQAKRAATMNGRHGAKLSVAKKSALTVEWQMERASPKALRERAIKEGYGEVWE